MCTFLSTPWRFVFEVLGFSPSSFDSSYLFSSSLTSELGWVPVRLILFGWEFEFDFFPFLFRFFFCVVLSILFTHPYVPADVQTSALFAIDRSPCLFALSFSCQSAHLSPCVLLVWFLVDKFKAAQAVLPCLVPSSV